MTEAAKRQRPHQRALGCLYHACHACHAVLLGMGAVACTALRHSGLGACKTVDHSSLISRQARLFT